MKKNLISKYGYMYIGVSLDPVSECVPDQSLSVEEILRRFTQGTLLAADVERAMPYGEDISPDENENNLDPLYDPEYDLVDAYEDAASVGQLRTTLQSKRKNGETKQTKDKESISTQTEEAKA